MKNIFKKFMLISLFSILNICSDEIRVNIYENINQYETLPDKRSGDEPGLLVFEKDIPASTKISDLTKMINKSLERNSSQPMYIIFPRKSKFERADEIYGNKTLKDFAKKGFDSTSSVQRLYAILG